MNRNLFRISNILIVLCFSALSFYACSGSEENVAYEKDYKGEKVDYNQKWEQPSFSQKRPEKVLIYSTIADDKYEETFWPEPNSQMTAMSMMFGRQGVLRPSHLELEKYVKTEMMNTFEAQFQQIPEYEYIQYIPEEDENAIIV
ncbi:hypothetical protein KJ966_06080 [bacterium]|nr:hypothetical protein [bacterium]